MSGIAEHSRFREDPLGQLHRTARYIAGTTFGPTGFRRSPSSKRCVPCTVTSLGVAADNRPLFGKRPGAVDPGCTRPRSSPSSPSYERYGPRRRQLSAEAKPLPRRGRDARLSPPGANVACPESRRGSRGVFPHRSKWPSSDRSRRRSRRSRFLRTPGVAATSANRWRTTS